MPLSVGMRVLRACAINTRESKAHHQTWLRSEYLCTDFQVCFRIATMPQ